MLIIWLVPLITFMGVLMITESPGVTIFSTTIMIMIVGMGACERIEKGDEEFAVRDTVDIQSAVTGSKIEGDFVLGSGTIGGERYYAYWTSEGTHRKDAVERRVVEDGEYDTEVIEIDSVDSKIIFTQYKGEDTAFKIRMDHHYQRAEIFVPEGSIRYNYNLKAK